MEVNNIIAVAYCIKMHLSEYFLLSVKVQEPGTVTERIDDSAYYYCCGVLH
jgi:hypothetical protein